MHLNPSVSLLSNIHKIVFCFWHISLINGLQLPNFMVNVWVVSYHYIFDLTILVNVYHVLNLHVICSFLGA